MRVDRCILANFPHQYIHGTFCKVKGKMNITEITELKYMVEVLNTNAMYLLDGPLTLYNTAFDWFDSKLKAYPSDHELLPQFERNYVYFAEATGTTVWMSMKLLVTGKPEIQQDQIDYFMNKVGKTVPSEKVNDTLNFLHGYSSSPHKETLAKVSWQQLRHLRETLDSSQYLAYVAGEALVCFMATILADLHLRSYALNPKLKGSCGLLQASIVSDTLYGCLMNSCRGLAYYFPNVLRNS